jgi:hypothetical protein
MLHRDLYTRVVLTVIAGLLAWNTLARVSLPKIQAQPAPPHALELVLVDLTSKQYLSNLATAINSSAKGRELIAVISTEQPGRYFAVFK